MLYRKSTGHLTDNDFAALYFYTIWLFLRQRMRQKRREWSVIFVQNAVEKSGDDCVW
jgi:hypothetical protein